MRSKEVNVGIVGATGLVGGQMLDILEERNFPVGDLHVFASEASAGSRMCWKERDLIVENLATASITDLDVALFSAGGGVSEHYAPRFVESGAIVIDNSSAWRQDPDVPLVVSEVNPDELAHINKGIVANPNCTTMIAMPVLRPLHERAGLIGMSVTTFQAASGAGQRGVDELSRQLTDENQDNETDVFPKRLAGNVIPLRGNLVGRDTNEELKLLHESRRILKIADLAVSATCVSAPVFIGHSLSVEALFANEITPEVAEEVLGSAPGVKLTDIPNPLEAAGGDSSLVGRIRQSGTLGKRGLQLFIAGDNLRKGAALNAVQIAELLIH